VAAAWLPLAKKPGRIQSQAEVCGRGWWEPKFIRSFLLLCANMWAKAPFESFGGNVRSLAAVAGWPCSARRVEGAMPSFRPTVDCLGGYIYRTDRSGGSFRRHSVRWPSCKVRCGAPITGGGEGGGGG
jgi:hypothetical protein